MSDIAEDDSTDHFPLRELRGLDHAMRTIRGNLTAQESKRISVQQTITSLENDLTTLKNLSNDIDNQEDQKHVEREIQKARDELAAIN